MTPKELKLEIRDIRTQMEDYQEQLHKNRNSLDNSKLLIHFLINRFMINDTDYRLYSKLVDDVFNEKRSYDDHFEASQVLLDDIKRFRVYDDDIFFKANVTKQEKETYLKSYDFKYIDGEKYFDYLKSLVINPYESLKKELNNAIGLMSNRCVLNNNITSSRNKLNDKKYDEVKYSEELLRRSFDAKEDRQLQVLFNGLYRNNFDIDEYYDYEELAYYNVIDSDSLKVMGDINNPLTRLYRIYSIANDYSNSNKVNISKAISALETLEEDIKYLIRNYINMQYPYDFNYRYTSKVKRIGLDTPEKLINVYDRVYQNIVVKFKLSGTPLPKLTTKEDIKKEFNDDILKDDSIRFIFVNYLNNSQLNLMSYFKSLTSLMSIDEIVTLYHKLSSLASERPIKEEIAYYLAKVIAIRINKIDIEKVGLNYTDRKLIKTMYAICISQKLFNFPDISLFKDFMYINSGFDHNTVSNLLLKINNNQ